MATYQQYLRQIEDLKGKAEKARQKEMSTVLDQIRSLMEDNGIALEDLQGVVPSNAAKAAPRVVAGARRGRKPAAGKKGATPRKVAPQYRGPDGQEWTGRGRKPVWVREAIESGQSLDDYRITA